METEKILLKYTIPVIKDLILNYAFDYKNRRDPFEIEYFEVCTKAIDNVRKLYYKTDILGAVNILFQNACKSGNIKLIKYVMKYYNNLNLDRGIIKACESGNLELVKYLSEIHTNKSMDWGNGMIMACKSGNMELIEFISTHIDIINKDHVNVWYQGFMGACEKGHIEIVKFMLLYLKDNNCEVFIRRGILSAACGSGNKEIVNLLIEQGWVKDFIYAAANAATNNHFDILELLIDKCIENNINLNYGENTPFGHYHYESIGDEIFGGACYSGNINMVQYLMEKDIGDLKNGLLYACRGGHINIFNFLLDNINKTVDIETMVKNIEWNDLFICACREGHDLLAKLILRIAEDQIIKYNEALIAACGNGHLKIVKTLMKKKAKGDKWDINFKREANYRHPPQYIIEHQYSITLEAIINYNSALENACKSGQLGIVKLLIGKGNLDLEYLLSLAVTGGNLEMVKLMVERKDMILNEAFIDASLAGHAYIINYLAEKISNEPPLYINDDHHYITHYMYSNSALDNRDGYYSF